MSTEAAPDKPAKTKAAKKDKDKAEGEKSPGMLSRVRDWCRFFALIGLLAKARQHMHHQMPTCHLSYVRSSLWETPRSRFSSPRQSCNVGASQPLASATVRCETDYAEPHDSWPRFRAIVAMNLEA